MLYNAMGVLLDTALLAQMLDSSTDRIDCFES